MEVSLTIFSSFENAMKEAGGIKASTLACVIVKFKIKLHNLEALC